MTRSSIDITVPVLNEERAIGDSLTALVSYFSTHCPYEWYVTVVDNGSTDRTWNIADAFSRSDARLRTIRLDRAGRGGALKAAWSTSTADIVAYMDVDLSTDLDTLQPLLRPVVDDDCDLAIGSRLAPGALIDRSMRREVVSRLYNAITRSVLRYHIRDAQCGFKAMRASLAQELIPWIEDDGWFFDTELIYLAWRRGMRIREVPVRWVEDDDSRVRIVKTAVDDLRGIRRIRKDRDATLGKATAFVGTPNRPVGPFSEEHDATDFDRFADAYEVAVDRSVSFTGKDSSFFAARKVEVIRDIVRRSVGPLEGVRALDVGCGTGSTDSFLAPLVGELHGADISEEMLERARQNVAQATFHWYDGEKLPFPEDSFDLAFAICVFHHIPPSRRFKVVSEMVRITRPDGVVAMFEHNPRNPLTRHAVNSCELDTDAVLLPAREAVGLLREAAQEEPEQRHFLFTPFGGALGRGLDRRLGRVPLGGQYVAWVQLSRG
jgi:ubiquinone/menaquinone biosynthesis C-methylase UbiE